MAAIACIPFLRKDDVITIDKGNINEIKIGDIVVFKNENRWIAHRLIKKCTKNNKKYLLTKGDTCWHTDLLFSENNFIGKVASYSRKSKQYDLNTTIFKFKGLFLARLSILLTPMLAINLLIMNAVNSIKENTKTIFSRLIFISKNSRKLTSINIIFSIPSGHLPVYCYLYDQIACGWYFSYK